MSDLPVRTRPASPGRHAVRVGRPVRWPRRILIAANVIIAVTLLGTAATYGYVRYRLGQIKRTVVPGLITGPSGTVSTRLGVGAATSSTAGVSSSDPFTMLIVGSDTRDLSGANNAQFGSAADAPGQRSDSILLVRVVPRTHSLALFSIPRDTTVPVPGYGTTRINTAFNTGNPTLLVRVLQQDFGIGVNHVAEFNFDTFEAVADAIGGVEQWFPTPARDTYSGLSVGAGCQSLAGEKALAFVRSREYEYHLDGGWHYQLTPESDLGRIQRQQAFTEAAVHKAEQVAPTNPLTLDHLIASLTKNVTLDSNFSDSLILSLAERFRSGVGAQIPSFTYPTANIPDSGALSPDTALGRQVIQQWLAVGTSPSTPTTTRAPSVTATTAPPTTSVVPSSVSVEVLNGTGASGQATQAAAALHDLGYATTVDATPGPGLAETTVDYAPDALAAARQLQSQLVGGARLVEDGALAPTAYSLELVTGGSYGGVRGVAGTVATTTTTPTTVPASEGTTTAIDPSASSYYKGRYVPPGRVPGQIPATCPS